MEKNELNLNDRNRRVFFTRDSRFTLSKAENGMATLKGYPITFNTLSDDRGGYKVRILPGSAAFASQTFAVINHDYNYPLATSDTGTLRILPADDYGIPVEIDLPDVSYARDLQELVAKKIVRGMSFAAIPESVVSNEKIEGDQKIVEFCKFTTDEFTVTPIPAFMSATIAIADSPSDAVRKTAATRLSTLVREQSIRLQKLRLEALNTD